MTRVLGRARLDIELRGVRAAEANLLEEFVTETA
jgi:hypothetical protein